MHRKKKPLHGTGKIPEPVLAHKNRTVVQFCRQVQAFVHNGAYHAPRLQQTAEKSQHRPKIAFMVQIPASQHKIAKTGPVRVKVRGHALKKKIQVQAQGIGKYARHARPYGMSGPARFHKFAPQKCRWVSPACRTCCICRPKFFLRRQAAGAEIQHRCGNHMAVGQRQQAVADVTHGGHGKSMAQGRRTAAGIKCGDQMDRIVGMPG